jgi:hypothetical protein
VKGEEGEQKLVANLKFRKPGTYLISLRNMAGIEAARFYITDDTILVNDRINKIVYHGSTEYLLDKYGISVKYLPMLLGDIIMERPDKEFVKCIENEAEINEKRENSIITYKLNCSRKKVKSVTAENPVSGQEVNISFDKFVREENLWLSRSIDIRDNKEENAIKITIERISRTASEDINFIPGKSYKYVLLK